MKPNTVTISISGTWETLKFIWFNLRNWRNIRLLRRDQPPPVYTFKVKAHYIETKNEN